MQAGVPQIATGVLANWAVAQTAGGVGDSASGLQVAPIVTHSICGQGASAATRLQFDVIVDGVS